MQTEPETYDDYRIVVEVADSTTHRFAAVATKLGKVSRYGFGRDEEEAIANVKAAIDAVNAMGS